MRRQSSTPVARLNADEGLGSGRRAPAQRHEPGLQDDRREGPRRGEALDDHGVPGTHAEIPVGGVHVQPAGVVLHEEPVAPGSV